MLQQPYQQGAGSELHSQHHQGVWAGSEKCRLVVRVIMKGVSVDSVGR